MIKNFSSYLTEIKEYECVCYTLRDVIRFSITHPGVLDNLWAKLIKEGTGPEFEKFYRCLEKGGLYLQTSKDSEKARKKDLRMELRVYEGGKVACVKISNLPIWN